MLFRSRAPGPAGLTPSGAHPAGNAESAPVARPAPSDSQRRVVRVVDRLEPLVGGVQCEISDPNKEILSLTVKKKYGTVKVTDNTFKMPKEDVTVVVLIKDKYSQDKWCIEDFEYERYEVGDIEDENYINEMTVKGFSGKGVEKLKNNKEVVLPAMNLNGEKVEAVYEKSFVNKGITKLTVPGNYKKIYDEAFKGNKIKSLVLNEGLVYIFDRTFANNEIEEFVAPKSFKYASKAAFQNNKLKKIRSLCAPHHRHPAYVRPRDRDRKSVV